MLELPPALNPADRIKIITHEIPNTAGTVKTYCGLILRKFVPLAKKYAGREAARQRKDLRLSQMPRKPRITLHLNRVANNLEQIHLLTREIQAVRDAVYSQVKKTETETVSPERMAEYSKEMKKLREQHAADTPRLLREVKSLNEKYPEVLATFNEPIKPDVTLSPEQMQEILNQLQVRYDRITRHFAAINHEVTHAPTSMRNEYPALQEYLEGLRNGIGALKEKILAATPGGHKEFNLAEAIENIAKNHPKLKLFRGKASITTRLPEEPLTMTSEKNLAITAIGQLVTNAFDHKDPKRDPKILIQAEDRGDHIRVRVTDNGKGIPNHVIPLIFGEYTGREMQDRQHDAHGLGLSIVRLAVEGVQGGTVNVRSIVGRGTRFELLLPKQPRGASGHEA